jgi:excisionase family DNA binding protein
MKRELMTTAAAAKYIHMSRSWIYDHLKRKHPRVPVIRLGGALRFDADALDKFMDEQAQLSARRN